MPSLRRRAPRKGKTEPDGESHRDQRSNARARPRRRVTHDHRLTSTRSRDGVIPGAPCKEAACVSRYRAGRTDSA